MVKRVYFGAVANEHVRELKDVNNREFRDARGAGRPRCSRWACIRSPSTDVMHVSVVELLRHVAASKLGN